VSHGARTIYKAGKFGPFGWRSKCIPCNSILPSDHLRNGPPALSVYWVTAVYQFSDRGQTELHISCRPPKPTVLLPTTDSANQYTVRNRYTHKLLEGLTMAQRKTSGVKGRVYSRPVEARSSVARPFRGKKILAMLSASARILDSCASLVCLRILRGKPGFLSPVFNPDWYFEDGLFEEFMYPIFTIQALTYGVVAHRHSP
jgi:hypothetical protein